MRNLKAFTLVEVLISLGIVAIIIVSIYSFKIFVSRYLESQILKNNMKNLAAQMYYKTLITMEFDNLLEYLKENQINWQFNIGNTIIKYSNYSMSTVEVKNNDGSKSIYRIRLEKCEISTNYRKKQIKYVFYIPFIAYISKPKNIAYISKPKKTITNPLENIIPGDRIFIYSRSF
ncbi:MAG: prepilin-type N-terminal cleavage/methylation domain-containing protein [Candidatus Calescibacterium sp.]|nr:prepilin-type N-terminal cleavage/methylation domain-containing protein [Candidatus Calescibacterium sp.]MDW8132407.1 prepilin-type N-terminal cleavage/methylation domain-containing protein [Candidatus Calescibacterium sp.]